MNKITKKIDRNLKLDIILNYLLNYCKGGNAVPLRPEDITYNSKIYIERVDSCMLLSKLYSDGYVEINSPSSIRYKISQNGIDFIQNNSYTSKYNKSKLNKYVKNITLYTDLITKPLGLISLIIVVIFGIIKLVNL